MSTALSAEEGTSQLRRELEDAQTENKNLREELSTTKEELQQARADLDVLRHQTVKPS